MEKVDTFKFQPRDDAPPHHPFESVREPGLC